MRKHLVFFIVGAVVLMIPFVNLALMQAIEHQEQSQIEKILRTDYGWIGEGDIFNLDALYDHGLIFSNEWATLYDNFIALHSAITIEIRIVTVLCGALAAIFFSLGAVFWRERVLR